MTPNPVMPKAMQIVSLKRIFTGLNPDIGIDLIDWAAHVEETLTLPENRLELSIAYPQYTWFSDETEMKSVKRESLQETKELLDYMLSAVPEEAQADFKAVFDDYLSRVRYSIERNLKIAPLKKEIVALRKQLEESKTKDGAAPPPPQAPRPLRWTTELERKLRDVFEVTFIRAGLSPRKFLPFYRLELEVIETLTTEDEMIKAVEELAKELVEEERVRKIRPPRVRPLPERPPREERIGLPPEEEEPFFIEAPPAVFPVYPEKSFIPSRRPTGTEVDDIWDAYRMAITMCGKNPDRYRREFEDWIENFLFTSWEEVKSNYASLIANICEEKGITLIPRALPAEVIDELVHWITSVNTIEYIVDSKKLKRKPKTIEEVIDKLDEMGKPGVPRSDVIAAVKRGWEEKAPNYIIVTKEYLETLIGEPLK